MSPRNFAKHQYRDATFIYGSRHPRFLKDREPNKLITKIKNKVYTYKAYISSFTKKIFKSPAKVQFEHLPYQTRPEVPEAEIDLKAIREQRRVAKQSDQ